MIGTNGSGTSPSVQLAAGILRPTTGSVEPRGRVDVLFELNTGFHPDFTGRECARLRAVPFGLSTQEIQEACDSYSVRILGQGANPLVRLVDEQDVAVLTHSEADRGKVSGRRRTAVAAPEPPS